MFVSLKKINQQNLLNVSVVAAALLFAGYLGNNIAISGKIRFRIVVLLVPIALLFICNLKYKAKFRLLILSLLLVSIQMPSIQYRFFLSEMLLFILAFLLIPVFRLKKRKNSLSNVNYLVLVPYILFAVAGFITAILYGGISTWHIFCAIPLSWMYVAMNMVRNSDDAFRIVGASGVGVFIFFCIYQLANIAGFVTNDFSMGWRMGSQFITIGPIHYILHSCVFSSFIALGFVIANMMVIYNYRSRIISLIYLFIVIIFAWALISSGTRGGLVGAVAGTILMFLLLFKRESFRISIKRYFPILIISLIFISAYSVELSGHLDNQINRFKVLSRSDLASFSNLKYRMNLLRLAIDDVTQNPLGNGFHYMWSEYKYDDAIVYVHLLEGTGVLGTICFIIIVIQMFLHFLRCLIGKYSESQKMLAALGIGTLVCGLIAGISSESIMVSSMHSFIFWAILASCYSATQHKKELYKSAVR